MNNVSKVSFGVPRLTKRLCVPFIIKRSRPYFVVPSILKGGFGFPVIPSVPIRRLNQLGLLPPDAEVCGDVYFIHLVLSTPSVTSNFNRSTYFDDSLRLRFGDE